MPPVPDFRAKRKKLAEILHGYHRVMVSLSGGKDSYFLSHSALEVLGQGKVLLCFARTSFISENSRQRIDFCRRALGTDILEVDIDFFSDERLSLNPRDRCYLCKRLMFSALLKTAAAHGIERVLDGSTVSDLSEHRPGRKALEELEIDSPLTLAGISSEEISRFLHRRGYSSRFVASSTCLATRFPYNHPLRPEEMKTIGTIEAFILERGIHPVRVRWMEDGVRIETTEINFPRILKIRGEMMQILNTRGLRFLTLDLGGLKRGAWD